MSFWTNIYGTVNFDVPSNGTNIKSFDDAKSIITNHFGPFKTAFNKIDSDIVNLPTGSEGSIEYHITDMTDYSEHEIRSNYHKTYRVGVIFTGDLRDFWNNEKLIDWIKSIDSIFLDDDKRAIINNGLFTFELPDKIYTTRFNYDDGWKFVEQSNPD